MIRDVAISDCVHYCAFRYGRNEFNPYEQYIVGLSEGRPVADLRQKFMDFILHYRPNYIGEALGISGCEPVDLWLLPWKSWLKLFKRGGWQSSAHDAVDIMTHFSVEGVSWMMICKEFEWLERAWVSISENGYQPDRYGYIEVFELRKGADSRFLVEDGNHRLSALHALGFKRVKVIHRFMHKANHSYLRFWPLVLSGHISKADALAILNAYWCGNNRPFRSEHPASLVY